MIWQDDQHGGGELGSVTELLLSALATKLKKYRIFDTKSNMVAIPITS
jgi:hypothetical protein